MAIVAARMVEIVVSEAIAAVVIVEIGVRVRKETDREVGTVVRVHRARTDHHVHRETVRHVHKANKANKAHRVSVVRVRKETDHKDKEGRAANNALRDHRVHKVSEPHVQWEIVHHAHRVSAR